MPVTALLRACRGAGVDVALDAVGRAVLDQALVPSAANRLAISRPATKVPPTTGT
jgi:hypothetical protein